jgi:hypothetical protein
MNFYSPPRARADNATALRARQRVLKRRAVITVPGAQMIQAYAESLYEDSVSIVSPIPFIHLASCAIAIDVPVQGSVHKVRAPGRIVSCALSGLAGFRVRVQFTKSDDTIGALLR